MLFAYSINIVEFLTYLYYFSFDHRLYGLLRITASYDVYGILKLFTYHGEICID